MDKVNDSLIDRLRTDAEWFAVPSSHDDHNELWETRDLLREAANALVAQNKPCTDAKEMGHGCYRAVKAENELAAQKEQYRVLTDEMLVMMDERNAAVLDSERYRWLRVQSWFCSPLAVVTKPIEAIKLGYDCPSRDRLDALIDASMREMK